MNPIRLLICCIAYSLNSCGTLPLNPEVRVVDTLLVDQISIRAIALSGDRIWYGGDKGRYGYVDLKTGKRLEANAVADSVRGEIRSIAVAGQRVLIANAGSPTRIFSVADDLSRREVYSENHPDAFYDSMRALSGKHLIAVGDPIGGCFSILQSFDGGETWDKMPCRSSVQNLDGEAAFAASNGNIAAVGRNIWIFTGGKSSRVLKSVDSGKTWKAYATPMVSGKSMTGTFAGDFYDAQNGIIVGGDYESRENKSANKAVTDDGGITWSLIADGTAFGYASTVKFAPNGRAREIVAAGSSGVFLTDDGGATWKKILNDVDIHAVLFGDRHTLYAAGKGKIIRIRLR